MLATIATFCYEFYRLFRERKLNKQEAVEALVLGKVEGNITRSQKLRNLTIQPVKRNISLNVETESPASSNLPIKEQTNYTDESPSAIDPNIKSRRERHIKKKKPVRISTEKLTMKVIKPHKRRNLNIETSERATKAAIKVDKAESKANVIDFPDLSTNTIENSSIMNANLSIVQNNDNSLLLKNHHSVKAKSKHRDIRKKKLLRK